MDLRPLDRSHFAASCALLTAAFPYDHADIVAEEKLFGGNGTRGSLLVGAWSGAKLVGVLACAGRWVKLLAVEPSARRHGVGAALMTAARQATPDGARLRIADHPGNYLSPGIDARDQASIGFFERRGFARTAEVENLRAPLEDNPLVTQARADACAARTTGHGYQLVRGHERPNQLLHWIRTAFASVWAVEVERAMRGPRRAVHAAFDADGRPVAFAAADGNNQGLGWFGPAGTDPTHRGRGLGEALLLRCLLDVRGLPDAGVIAWIGPKAFYERGCGARSDRSFVQLEEQR